MKLTFRIWVYIIAMMTAIVAIGPNFQSGVVIKSIDSNSILFEAGASAGEIIKSINGIPILNLQDYSNVMSNISIEPIEFIVKTEKVIFNYSDLTLGIVVDNLTVIDVSGAAKNVGIKKNMTLIEINGYKINDDLEFYNIKNQLEPKSKLTIKTNKNSYNLFINKPLDITAGNVPRTKIRTGLDLQGGARGLVKPERKLNQKELADLLAISRYRLNIYGISDVNVRTANDLSGNTYMLIEVAGATPKELSELIAKQGKFEAKIGNETIFVGGKQDITSVCRNDATCSGVEACYEVGGGYSCKFMFAVYLSEEAAKRHALITANLTVNATEQGNYLSKKLDLYLDDKLADSLLIAEGLKGKVTTQVQVQGSGFGKDNQAALDSARESMQKLQTVLITGSLPFKLEIVKLDSISPFLGAQFIQAIFIASALAFAGVFIVLYIRFRRIKISLLIFSVMTSEILMTLAFAALIKWNLDLASIAGIIASIGTGVDDQIVIIDESRIGKEYSWKERIKRAFIIVFGAYSTVVASLLPLGWAGAGLLKGFAITTFIGISIGVFITRPAFADMISKMAD